MTGQPTPKPWIQEIHAYVPGKSAGKDGAFTMQVTDAHGRTIGSGEVGRWA